MSEVRLQTSVRRRVTSSLPKVSVRINSVCSRSLVKFESRPQRLSVAAPEIKTAPECEKVFIRSGIRFDYLIYDEDRTFLRELCEHHVSGQLKVAPEHISNAVLEKMGKPSVEVYKKFVKAYKDMNEKLGKNST